MDLRQHALQALCAPSPEEKLALLAANPPHAADAHLVVDARLPEPAGLPGRPARPSLVDPAQLRTRSVQSAQGRAALVHAICHIEFNAINLALDAVWRFPDMPESYYRDWWRVAVEEGQHFALLHAHLQHLGLCYGDLPAHDGLWTMCEKTKHDVLARMALVPRTLEARGLDATPLIQSKLRQVPSQDAQALCAILDIILRDEIGHVAIGNRWYRWLCQRAGLEPLAQYRQLARQHRAPTLRPPLNQAARLQAGFTQEELDDLGAAAVENPAG